MITEERAINVEEKVDYRITMYSTYPNDVEIVAIVLLNSSLNDEILEKVSNYGKIVKTFPFLNVVKVRSTAKNVVKLADEDFVRYIMLDEVLSS